MVEAPAPERAKPKVARKFADTLLASVRRHVEQSGLAEEDTRRSLDLAVGKLKRFRRTVAAAYQARGYKRVLSAGDALTEDGRLAVDLVRDVQTHGVEPSPYPIKALDTAFAAYDSAQKELISGTVPDNSTVTGKLVAIVAGFEPKDDESYSDQRRRVAAQIVEAGLSDDDAYETLARDVDAWFERRRQLQATLRQTLVDMDILTVQGFFQYHLDFKYLIVAHPYDAMGPDDIARAPERYKKDLLLDIAGAGERLGTALRALWPRHSLYQKTRAALAKYQALADANSVPPFKLRGVLKQGMKGPKVLELKRRLEVEGFYTGDMVTDVFDEPLTAAVTRYQNHRQLKADGIVRDSGGADGATKKSLSVPMSERVKQLRLSLQRWREFKSGDETSEMFFRVNIPQFEVEVWEGDTVARKHRIIVGNNTYELDPDHGRKGHLNRTALISNVLQTVVLNPVWNVPERIKIAEVLPDAAKDPTFMERHGYKVRVQPDGAEQIYQEAGPGNALGQIKLLFPNEYAIYMHDTPKKKLFDRTLRAFSHGCMRLHDPVSMATFLLGRDNQLTTAKVQEILKSRKERAFKLKRPLPIHIEYNTIAFEQNDDEAVFLNDVYGYDKAFWEGAVPVVREEEIPVVKTELPMPEWERDDNPLEDNEAPVPVPSFDPDEKPAVKPDASDRPARAGVDDEDAPAAEPKPRREKPEDPE